MQTLTKTKGKSIVFGCPLLSGVTNPNEEENGMAEVKVREGDHLKVHDTMDKDGRVECTLYHADGTGEEVSTTIGGEGAGKHPLEACPNEPNMFHISSSGRRGPAMANSAQFCEGYVRIFGDKRFLN